MTSFDMREFVFYYRHRTQVLSWVLVLKRETRDEAEMVADGWIQGLSVPFDKVYLPHVGDPVLCYNESHPEICPGRFDFVGQYYYGLGE